MARAERRTSSFVLLLKNHLQLPPMITVECWLSKRVAAHDENEKIHKLKQFHVQLVHVCPLNHMTNIECFFILFCHSDGLKAYTAPVGHVMQLPGMPVYLNDSTYDGSTEQG